MRVTFREGLNNGPRSLLGEGREELQKRVCNGRVSSEESGEIDLTLRDGVRDR